MIRAIRKDDLTSKKTMTKTTTMTMTMTIKRQMFKFCKGRRPQIKKMQAEKYVLELKNVKLTHNSTPSGKERSVI